MFQVAIYFQFIRLEAACYYICASYTNSITILCTIVLKCKVSEVTLVKLETNLQNKCGANIKTTMSVYIKKFHMIFE